jgi:signal peptidase I
MHSLAEGLRLLLKLAAWLATAVAVLNFWFVDIVLVPHNGMAPTLIYGDRALVWRNAHVDVGDVVVCQHPANPAASVLARAVAFAGHTVSSDEQGNLLVDSDRDPIEGLPDQRFYDVTRDKLFTMRAGEVSSGRHHHHRFFLEAGTMLQLRPYTIRRGVYLLGDNRSDTIDDSREFGEIDPAHCRGQVFMRVTLGPPRYDDVHHGYFDLIF